MTPLVSAIVATYRPGRYLAEAIASALAQTMDDLEVVVADDGNDPAVKSIVDSMGDPRVVYRANATRLGPARNHWSAFESARGKYLSILNHDDCWRPTFIKRLVAPFERDAEIDLAFCDHEVIDADGRTMTDATRENTIRWGRATLAEGLHRPFASLVVRQSIPIAMGAVFRRDAIDFRNLPDVGPAYDLWLAYELARNGKGAWYVPDRLSAWRQHPAQLTQTRNRTWAQGAVACWKAMAADPAFRGAVVDCKLSAAAVEEARSALSDRDWKTARRTAALAVAARPANWRAWCAFGLAHSPFRMPAILGGRP
jgi:glycosyltransferase involved in cell wall biosynthesis